MDCQIFTYSLRFRLRLPKNWNLLGKGERFRSTCRTHVRMQHTPILSKVVPARGAIVRDEKSCYVGRAESTRERPDRIGWLPSKIHVSGLACAHMVSTLTLPAFVLLARS